MKNLLIICIALVVVSCTSNSYYTIKPTNIARWDQGKEVTESVRDSLVLKTNFAFYQGYKNMAFDFEFINKSSKTVTIDPVNFYLETEALNDSFPKFKSQTIMTIDPERKITSLELDRAGRVNRHTGFLLFNLILGIFDFIGSFSSAPQTPEQIKEKEEQRKANDEYQEDAQKDFEEDLKKYNLSIEEWSKALRKTTLDQGQRVSGKVYFELEKRDEYKINLYCPVELNTFKVQYQQFKEIRDVNY